MVKTQTSVQQRLCRRYERILRDLDVLTRGVRAGALAHSSLDEKVDARRLQTVLEQVRAKLRVEVFALEDAVRELPNKETEDDICSEQ